MRTSPDCLESRSEPLQTADNTVHGVNLYSICVYSGRGRRVSNSHYTAPSSSTPVVIKYAGTGSTSSRQPRILGDYYSGVYTFDVHARFSI